MSKNKTAVSYDDINAISDKLVEEDAVFIIAVKRNGTKQAVANFFGSTADLAHMLISMGMNEDTYREAIDRAHHYLLKNKPQS